MLTQKRCGGERTGRPGALTRRAVQRWRAAVRPSGADAAACGSRALIIAAWLRGKMLPKDAIEQMVPLHRRKATALTRRPNEEDCSAFP